MQRTFSKVTKHDNWEEKNFFNSRFDVLSQGDESSKTPSSSPRFSGPGCSPDFCDTPSLVNTGKKVEDDDAQALRQLELCLRVHAKIASGVYSSPPPGTLSGPSRSRGGDPGGVVSTAASAVTPSAICVSDSVVSVSEVACAVTPSAVCVSDSVVSV